MKQKDVKKRNFIKRFFDYFRTKKSLIESISYFHDIASMQMDEAAKIIKELEQNKVYYLSAPGISGNELNKLVDALEQARSRIKWTVPNIIILNGELKELDEKELKKLLKELKKQKEANKQ